MKNETEFKRWVRARWEAAGGWSEAVEPRRGGSNEGTADLLLLRNRVLVPVELKMGYIKERRVFIAKTHEVKPSQIGWHNRFAEAGGFSFYMVCVGDRLLPSSPSSVAFVNYKEIEKWNEGIYNYSSINDRLFVSYLKTYLDWWLAPERAHLPVRG